MDMLPFSTPICCACLKPLTAQERHYYEYRCEVCEGKWRDRMHKWLDGGEDWEIDASAGVLPPL